ncbi:MAG: hypothetical protein J6Z47_06220, partial [Bacteroidales bacterium]|nr:hypothetical protein [Bacteroidales bacterium]
GTGTLQASGGSNYAGIGGGRYGYGYDSGADIVIEGGIITATGGNMAAGIGANWGSSIGNITINGGNVTATGGIEAAGIGCGNGGGGNSSCGDITFASGTVVVNADQNTGWGVGSLAGNTSYYSCGNITFVGGSVTVKGGIATTSEYGKLIYVDGESQGSDIYASSSNPFVYPKPATP